MKRILTVLLLIVTFIGYSQATKTFNSRLKVKDVPQNLSATNVLTLNPDGLFTYIPKNQIQPDFSDWLFVEGTASGGNLIVYIGDYQEENGGTRMEINDEDELIDFYGQAIMRNGLTSYNSFGILYGINSAAFNGSLLTSNHQYTLPDKNITFAGLSDIPTNYVTTDTGQTITAPKVFTSTVEVQDEAQFGSGLLVEGDVEITDNVAVSGELNASTIRMGTAPSQIAGSLFSLGKVSNVSSVNTAAFYDVSRQNTASTPSAETYGLISRVQSTSSNNDGGLIGGNLIGRGMPGSGVLNFNYGLISTAEMQNLYTEFLTANVFRTLVNSTGGEADYVRGASTTVEINDATGTFGFVQGQHVTLAINKGEVGEASVMYLDLDHDGTGPAEIGDDFSYLKIGNNITAVNEIAAGDTYAIRSLSPLNSRFTGGIQTELTPAEIHAKTSSEYITRGYLDDYRTQDEGVITGTIVIAGNSAGYQDFSHPTNTVDVYWKRVGNQVTYSLMIVFDSLTFNVSSLSRARSNISVEFQAPYPKADFNSTITYPVNAVLRSSLTGLDESLTMDTSYEYHSIGSGSTDVIAQTVVDIKKNSGGQTSVQSVLSMQFTAFLN